MKKITICGVEVHTPFYGKYQVSDNANEKHTVFIKYGSPSTVVVNGINKTVSKKFAIKNFNNEILISDEKEFEKAIGNSHPLLPRLRKADGRCKRD